MGQPSDHDLIPAWDETGVLRPMDKLDVHRRGLRHKAISVFVLAGEEVLIQQRAAGKYHTPGLWANTCCTHPHWGEDDLACAHRRLLEELGIAGLTLTPLRDIEYRADVGCGLTEHELVRIYTARTTRDLAPAPNPDEVQATAWVGVHELAADARNQPDIYTPWLRIYLDRHLDLLAAPPRASAPAAAGTRPAA